MISLRSIKFTPSVTVVLFGEFVRKEHVVVLIEQALYAFLIENSRSLIMVLHIIVLGNS